MTYRESIDWLYSTQTFGIKLGLENPTRLLREFLAFPRHDTRVIQVAGTNGKGSTCAFLESLARACGQKTGLFTSPHLVSYRERIKIGHLLIPEDTVARHLTALRDLVQDWENHPTFFELTLALAMRHFYEQECELIILEVGMGGRFDATSAVPADASIITPIALDHQQWLGDTLAEIAFEKAAICRQGAPVISAPQSPEATTVIAQTANQARAPLTVVAEPLQGFPLGLRGRHQAANAALAVETLHAMGLPLSYDSVYDGVSKVTHPGRFEVIADGAQTIILDIAHNPHAIEALVQTFQAEFPNKQAALIFGAADSKDIATSLQSLLPLASSIHLTAINSSRSTPGATLAAALPPEAAPHQQHASFPEAFAAAAEETLLVITGSAFLVGEAKAHLDSSSQKPLPSAQ